MNIQIRYLALALAAALAVGAGLAHQFIPKEVTKTQIVDHDVIKDHVVTVVKEISHPDGTKETYTTVVADKNENSTKKTTVTDVKPIPSLKPNWFATVGADVNSISAIADPTYQVGINRRILGPIFLGANAALGGREHRVGIQLGLEF